MTGLPDHRRLGLRLRAAALALDRWRCQIPAILLGQLNPPATPCRHGHSMNLPGASAAPATRARACAG